MKERTIIKGVLTLLVIAVVLVTHTPPMLDLVYVAVTVAFFTIATFTSLGAAE